VVWQPAVAERQTATPLLPPDALAEVHLGVSVSDSPDLHRLGMVEAHLRLALGEVARAMLVAGAGLVYGGHLDPSGYTSFLQDELWRYSRRDHPLLVCLPWPVHRSVKLTELRRAEDELGLCGHIVYLDAAGQAIDPATGRGEEPVPVEDPIVASSSLTRLREFMTSRTHARLLLGGRRSGFAGRMPGVLEEALLALEAKQPLFLAGGFGGVAADASVALGLSPAAWLPPLAEAPDDQVSGALEELTDAARRTGWRSDQNGLDDDENARLAASHRPSDVASLVALGLGRLHARADGRSER